MKTSHGLLCLAVATSWRIASALPSTNTYVAVTNDWFNANFSNVLELAENRLAENTNDIVGATLKLGYDVTFGDVASISNSLVRFMELADSVTCPAFSNEYWSVRPAELMYLHDFLPTVTPARLEADAPKAFLPGKPFPEKRYLEILNESGFW